MLDGGKLLLQLGGVLIAGRQISPPLIERLQSLSATHSRRGLAAWLCQEQQWTGPGGKPQVSVAMGVIGQLHQKGELQLPQVKGRPGCLPPGATAAPPQAQALVLAPLECDLALVQPIELIKVVKRRTRQYAIWQQLSAGASLFGCWPALRASVALSFSGCPGPLAGRGGF